MPPKPTMSNYQKQMFKIELVDLIDLEHELVILTNKFDWSRINELCSKHFCENNGRSSHSSRLVVGLLILKQLNNLSDVEVCQQLIQNPYYQYFCGFTHFEHEFKFNPSSLTKWRRRLGDEVFQGLLTQTVEMAIEDKVISLKDCSEVVSDTTVQEKNISFPTDSKLICKVMEHLVKIGLSLGVKYRQTYKRVSVRLKNKSSRLLHARKYGQAMSCVRQLRNRLGRLIRETDKQMDNLRMDESIKEALLNKLLLARRIFNQSRESKDKVYSVHEPEVSCISKGKAHKKYEFGNKVGIVSTIKNSFILSVKSFSNNPYDGHTLEPLIKLAEENSQVESKLIVLDKGYKGCKRQFKDKKVMLSGDRNLTKTMKNKLNKRSKIEPLIGLVKTKCGLKLNRLKGVLGDEINATLSAVAYNIRIILRVIFCFLYAVLFLSEFLNKKDSLNIKLV